MHGSRSFFDTSIGPSGDSSGIAESWLTSEKADHEEHA
jgi:hypothetical protein